jgi:type I restriction enzyme M protein
VAKAHQAFLETLDSWWIAHVGEIETLAPKENKKGEKEPGNVYALRRTLLASMEKAFAGSTLLTGHQIRGAFARYLDDCKADLKSIAASGWGPELIPDEDILQSQFPEVLAEMEGKRTRLAELQALFSAADEEDFEDDDDTGVLPGDQVKDLKEKLKALKGDMKLAKKDPAYGDWKAFAKEAEAIEDKLARHKELEDEAKQLKADLRTTEKRKDDLVEAARQKIGHDEARRVILERLQRTLTDTYVAYLRTDQRECIAALENLHDKYAVTMKEIEAKRDAATAKLQQFLGELGYA